MNCDKQSTPWRTLFAARETKSSVDSSGSSDYKSRGMFCVGDNSTLGENIYLKTFIHLLPSAAVFRLEKSPSWNSNEIINLIFLLLFNEVCRKG